MKQTYTRKQHFAYHPWKIIETSFDPARYKLAEGVLALANGYLGVRSSFEEGGESYDSLRGTYVAGVFDSYPNQTMIKLKGRPTHPNKMVNLPDFLPVQIKIDGERLDLAACAIESYDRTLHIDSGLLTRKVICTLRGGKRIQLETERFLSQPRRHIGAIRVAVTALDASAQIAFTSIIDGGVTNLGTKHLADVAFVNEPANGCHGVSCRTISTDINIAVAAIEKLSVKDQAAILNQDASRSSRSFNVSCEQGQAAVLDKIVAVATSRDIDVQCDPLDAAKTMLYEATADGFNALRTEHEKWWRQVWQDTEIDIVDKSGDCDLTQGLRYALFQMIQNAPNNDHTVNIGAKGLTGEHYFGTYFWDTEIFMLPMFVFAMPEVARNLVRFRSHALPGARAKAAEMDCEGAAYPFMSDADGIESSTLWQFGLTGIHVTAAVAWGVWYYYAASGDLAFIREHGIDVMVETSRFWASRVYFRQDIKAYVINRVLGPDEYHQGVDNNYYTNIMAQENLLKTCEMLEVLRRDDSEACDRVFERLGLTGEEIHRFRTIAEKMHLPYHDELGVNLQDDRFHLLEPHDLKADPLPGPVNIAWSYDRAMRTQLLRQADTVVAHVLLGDRFTLDQIRRDFDYYEPKTTHDSSLSFCSYAIIAALLGKMDMAYDYFLRTARLDLDDIHDNAWMGIHAANLGGAWQCVVFGFGGVRWYDASLSIAPRLPDQWNAFSFSIWWHGAKISVKVEPDSVTLRTNGTSVSLRLGEQLVNVGAEPVAVAYDSRPSGVAG